MTWYSARCFQGELIMDPWKYYNITHKRHQLCNTLNTERARSLFAIDGRCGHAGGILSNGRLVGKVATCPKHGAEYDVTTGKNLKKPRIPFAKAPDRRSCKVTIDGENVILEL